eukprot:750506-Hanusia_phi.AAC.6
MGGGFAKQLERMWSYPGWSSINEWLTCQEMVDRDQVLVVGHCLGGYHALKLAIENVKYDCKLLGVVALSPLLPQGKGIDWPAKFLEENSAVSHRHTSSNSASEWSNLPSIADFIKPENQNRPINVLVITGDADEVHSPQHYNTQLMEIAQKAKHLRFEWIRIEQADHQLGHRRVQISDAVTEFCCKNSNHESFQKPAILRAFKFLREALFDVVSLLFILNSVCCFQSGRFMSSPEGRSYLKARIDKVIRDFERDDRIPQPATSEA